MNFLSYFKMNYLTKKTVVYVSLYLILIAIFSSSVLLEPRHGDNYELLRIIIIVFSSILLTKYFLYMFLSPWYEVASIKREFVSISCKEGDIFYPKVSVLVPAWNEENGVLTTIDTLLNSTHKNMEILVIDNASTDMTAKNVLALIKNLKNDKREGARVIEVKYLYEGKQGKGHALNKGIKKSTGEIIISIDADCSVDAKAIENFVKYFKDPSIMAAVGNVKIGNTETIIGVVQYLEFIFSFYFKKAESLVNTIYIIGGAAGAFRKDIFKQLGKYSTTNITEDIELSVRIQAAGMKITYARDAYIYTEGATTINGLIKQRLRWKRGRFETFSEHRKMFFSRDKKHNKLLSWMILPLAIFGELQLSLEMLFLTFLYVFSFIERDFTSFYSGIIVVSTMFIVQVMFDEHKEKRLNFLLLAPIGWMLFYVSTFVESMALYRSIIGYIKKTEVTWQKWERQGVFSK